MNAEQAKIKNIIDMAVGFSAMTRVFEEGSDTCIKKELADVLPRIASAKSKQDFDKCHRSFCQWFENHIKTAKRKKKKNGTIKPSTFASYGQGGKVLNVALKVYVHYCHLPNPETTQRTAKWLHAAIDTKMLRYLKKMQKKMPDTEVTAIRANAIEQVDEDTYRKLQELVRLDINKTFAGSILPVEWDDIMWRQLNKTNCDHS